MPAEEKSHWLLVPVSESELRRVRRWAVRNGYGVEAAAARLLGLGLGAPEPRDGPNDGPAAALRYLEERRAD
jgi:hypothetical protein